MSIWEKVDEMVSRGKAPIVKLNPATEIRKPRRPRGRPRIIFTKNRQHYPMATPKGWALRCRAPGCQKKLRKDQLTICCSPACEARLRDICETYLNVLNGDMNPTDLPPYYRTSRNTLKVTL